MGACISQRYATFMLGRRTGDVDESCMVREAHEAFARESMDLHTLIGALAAHDDFITREPLR